MGAFSPRPLARSLFRHIGPRLRRWPAVDRRVQAVIELLRYRWITEVHALPPIFHYWSNRYLRPTVESLGFSNPDEFFLIQVLRCCPAGGGDVWRFVSLGAGNCDSEVRLARALVDSGCSDFTIECVDRNAQMLARGHKLALEQNVAQHIVGVRADLNAWKPNGTYDAVIANQSLHHVVNLEGLFDGVAGALAPHGRFVISDMIGRNGHRRWPEALAIVQEFWRELPKEYRFDHLLQRQMEIFVDRDCSVSGYEGIRSQDILPLLLDRFGFDLFIGFANVVDPFIDRAFGPNFHPEREWDRAFIDHVHTRDRAELSSGNVTPTHMFAVLTTDREARNQHLEGQTPQQSVRRPDR
jgi:SAM-dependent methyltransferase